MLLTATHVCFDDDGQELDILVAFKADSASVPRLFRAVLLRYSGKMDVAVLGLPASEVQFLPSPFSALLPATVVALGEGASNVLCALVCFSVSNDGAALRLEGQTRPDLEVPTEQLARLPALPPFEEAKVTIVQARSYGSSPPRADFLHGIATYGNEKGVSGGAVVGMEGGQLVLLGVHTHAQRLGTEERYMVVIRRMQVAEYDGPRAPAASDALRAAAPAAAPAAAAGAASAGRPSSSTNTNASVQDAESPELSGPKTQAPLRRKLEHAAAAIQSKSVFAVAHSVLRGRWSLAEILFDLDAGDDAARRPAAHAPAVDHAAAAAMVVDPSSAPSAAAHQPARRSMRFRVPAGRDSPDSSPRVRSFAVLYDVNEE